ncbi:MAG TPA: class I SAM-dependent methyltransferase [Pirellulales bacterium]
MKNNGVQIESWFDHPEWFEIGFQDVTKQEADFFEKAFKRWCKFPVKRLLEPACGSGRLVVEMARRGYDLTGFDLSQPSVDYLRRELKRRKLKGTAYKADMTRYRVPKKFDSAFCTYNSFRVLTTEIAARSFLQSTAAAVRPGGLFFLGLHLAPPGIEPYCVERWTGERGRTKVTTTLRIVASDSKRRVERLRINVLVREFGSNSNGKHRANGKPSGNGQAKGAKKAGAVKLESAKLESATKVQRLRDEFDYRLYTAAQIKQLFKSVPQWELVEVFDFWYKIDEPQKLDNDLVDALFVLRRR